MNGSSPPKQAGAGGAAWPEPGSSALPLVLVHGYLGGAEQWRELTRALPDTFRFIAIDLPGFGATRDEAAPLTIEGFAEHVIAKLDEMEIERFMLLGHSMGGMIVQEIAHRIPHRVDRLVLYGTGPLGRMPDRFEPLETSFERLQQDGVAKTARRIVATWFANGEHDEGFRLLNEIGATASPEAARSALTAMANWDGRDHLAGLTMPVLIVWGDRDRSYRWPQVEKLWQTIPDASLAVIPRASHAAHLEKPGIFIAIVKDFLAG